MKAVSPAVIWHDLECGGYVADLPLWRELAGAAPARVLDVGAGTGRVALDLARAGHAVTALDRDAELLAVLAERARAAALEVATVVADAAGFDLAGFALIAVPMQTLQLLPDAPARGRFFAAARRALVPGGRLAAALATALEGFEGEALLPAPDVAERDGWRFVSQPVAVREDADAAWIERVRITIGPDGGRTSAPDVVRLARVSADGLAAEAAEHGLALAEVREIPATDEHVGTEVVVLRG
jgi:SAM-dependent methyltransferase